jgi:hypothetical protein
VQAISSSSATTLTVSIKYPSVVLLRSIVTALSWLYPVHLSLEDCFSAPEATRQCSYCRGVYAVREYESDGGWCGGYRRRKLCVPSAGFRGGAALRGREDFRWENEGNKEYSRSYDHSIAIQGKCASAATGGGGAESHYTSQYSEYLVEAPYLAWRRYLVKKPPRESDG